MLRGGRGLFLAENAHQKIDLSADVHEAQQQANPDDDNKRPETNVCFDWRFFIGFFHAIAFPHAVEACISYWPARQAAGPAAVNMRPGREISPLIT